MERADTHSSSPTPVNWVSMRRACEILGVNQATLRHWTDTGQVRAFLTPGGHRRYAEHELLAMTGQALPHADGPSLEALLLRSRERYESLVRQRLGSSAWFQSFSPEARLRFRILGNSILHLLASFVLAGNRRERQHALDEGREVATQHGKEAASLGLSLTEATEAFLLFRTPVLESLHNWLRTPHPGAMQPTEVLKRVNHFMDQVLLAMASSHEQHRSPASRTVETP